MPIHRVLEFDEDGRFMGVHYEIEFDADDDWGWDDDWEDDDWEEDYED